MWFHFFSKYSNTLFHVLDFFIVRCRNSPVTEGLLRTSRLLNSSDGANFNLKFSGNIAFLDTVEVMIPSGDRGKYDYLPFFDLRNVVKSRHGTCANDFESLSFFFEEREIQKVGEDNNVLPLGKRNDDVRSGSKEEGRRM
jgi:hypothetical protein